MNRILFLACFMMALNAPFALAQETYVERSDDSGVVSISDDDARMNAAIAAANDSIMVFFDALDSGLYPREWFMMKVLTETVPDEYEHMWVIFIDMNEDGEMRGLLIHNPYAVASDYAEGDVLIYTPERISDWRYLEDGKWRGDFTTRVLFEHMPPEQRDELILEYHDNPLPEGASVE